MNKRAKHAQRSHRSYHANMAQMHTVARSQSFKTAARAERKEHMAAIANFVRAAKSLTHKTTEK